ncbi:hypothetical protein SDC9_41345 [bioreactor metagenome]|uniref:Uncharacterized protein n=1 Tax=bioreactor metagenome TaxID=1076179 RepID=A0A644VV09_9ZZZZ
MSAQKKKQGETKEKFHSKHIKHDPNGESARAIFGLKATDTERKGTGR